MDFSDYKYDAAFIGNANTELTNLSSFSKPIALTFFDAALPVYRIINNERFLIEERTEIDNHSGEFCTDKQFSNIIGAQSGNTLIGRIDLTIMGPQGEEPRTLLYFDMDLFFQDLRKARDLAVPIDVYYYNYPSPRNDPSPRQTTKKQKGISPKKYER